MTLEVGLRLFPCTVTFLTFDYYIYECFEWKLYVSVCTELVAAVAVPFILG